MSHSCLIDDTKLETKTSYVPLIVSLFLLVHIIFALVGPVQILSGELVDTDSYTRLNRVLFVYEQGNWNHSIYPRSNAPYGESIHWTKPMDILLLAGGVIVSIVVPFSTGLHLWGVVISPLLHIVAFAGMIYLTKKVDRLGVILLAMLFLLQPLLTSYFIIGRPDHHSLILAIFSWFIVGLFAGLENPQKWGWFVLIGGLGALGLWVSVEFLVPIGLFLSVYTLVWIWKGKERLVPNLVILGSLFVCSTFFLMLERLGEEFFRIEYDRISIAHIGVLGFILCVWAGIALFSQKTTWLFTAWGRVMAIGLGTVLASWGQWKLFPGFFWGPLVGMDPAVRNLVWDHVAETQPLGQLFPLHISDAIMSLGIGIVVAIFLGKKIGQMEDDQSVCHALLGIVGIALFMSLALFERRWTPYVSILVILPYAGYVRVAIDNVEKWWIRPGKNMVTLTLTVCLLLWPMVIGAVLAMGESKDRKGPQGECQVSAFTEYLARQERWNQSSKTILAYKDFSPEILYRTSHTVVGTPMHRNRDGIGDSLAIMNAKNFSDAYAIIQERHIDLILLCLHSQEESDAYTISSAENTFYQKLKEGVSPDWLKEVILAEELSDTFRLFEVMHSPYQS